MSSFVRKPVLGRLAEGEFLNRGPELEALRLTATGSRRADSNLLVVGPPRVGKTELMRQAFDLLFHSRDNCAPFYYAIKSGRLEPGALAFNYLTEFLAQFIAFRRGGPGVLPLSADWPSSALRMADARDYSWIRGVVDTFNAACAAGNTIGMLKAAVSAPRTASEGSGVRIFVMLDDFHKLGGSEAGSSALQELLLQSLATGRSSGSVDSSSPVYSLGGLRRALLEMLPPEEEVFEGLELLSMDRLPEGALEEIIGLLASKLGVQISDSTTDLMIQQLSRDLFYIRSLIAAAASRRVGLKSFMEFERLYTRELVEGRLGQYFDALIRDAGPTPWDRKAALEVLWLVTSSDTALPMDVLSGMVRDTSGTLDGVLGRLHARELIEMGARSVRRAEDAVLADYVRSRHRDAMDGRPKPIAGDQLLGEKLKTSYRLMMSRYNRTIAARLVDVLLEFDFQAVPASLFDCSLFDDLYSGVARAQTRRALNDEPGRIRLPQIVFVTDLGSGEEPGLGWQFFGASGFEGGVYSEANEVTWTIGLINSREPLDVDTLAALEARLAGASEAWRREQALPDLPGWKRSRDEVSRQRNPVGGNAVRWFISKEGFSGPACERLSRIGAHKSVYSQLDLIFDYLSKLAKPEAEIPRGVEFELVIPVEDEAELIAARTAEQIARSADFDSESINQIKTALIEACSSAAQHMNGSDRRISQHFVITGDRLVITVTNKGEWFEGLESQTGTQRSQGFGRGLEIIKTLMDDVRLQRTEDGVSLVMTKLLKQSQAVS
jgi:anti-sigma regulatory factor (Ser/Thr protein kinase)